MVQVEYVTYEDLIDRWPTLSNTQEKVALLLGPGATEETKRSYLPLVTFEVPAGKSFRIEDYPNFDRILAMVEGPKRLLPPIDANLLGLVACTQLWSPQYGL